MKRYDLIVIGGSFAGLACAQSAAGSGLKTLLLDKKKTADAYTQSTGIFVKEIADAMNLPSHLRRRISRIRLYAPNMDFIDLESPNYYFFATDTRHVLGWMANEASAAGVHLSHQQAVHSIHQHETEVVLPKQGISSRYLVGADGARSKTARLLALGTNKQFLLGVENEIEGFENADRDCLHVFIDPDLAQGYIGWLVPGVHSLQIGLATRYPNKPDIGAFRYKLARYFGGSLAILSKRGGFIPCGGVVTPYANGVACLIGDAAGMVSPLTAGGIHPAIETGHALGDAVSRFINDGGRAPHLQIAEVVPSFRIKRELRRGYDLINPSPELFNRVVANPLFRRMAEVIFFHHRGLFSLDAWKEILLRDT